MSGDDRVVGLEFDNSKFESKLAQTIASLDKLQTTLDKQNGKKALEDLSTAGSKFDVSNITAGIEGVSAKFLALSTIGITALANIASKAVSVGIDLAKSLSLDNVLAGFHEYETNMNSIQTIMTNTRKDGSTLQDVNKALDELNHYSDQTIYNFSEMARNIGTFTAAGVDLNTSTQSIKGIANLAAASGSDANQAATAMYQLSQAMASGTVKLMDWNSVVNAGMGGEMFQEALFNAGKLKGTLDGVGANTTFDKWKASGNSFRDSLESGWITADVLTTTLQGFTGDLSEAQLTAMGYTQQQAQEVMAMGQSAKDAATQVKTFTQLVGTVKESIGSGWSQTFKLIIGDFDQARGLFTGINSVIGDMIQKGADNRNNLLQGWADLGGRGALIDGVVRIFFALGAAIKPVQQAFHNIFPPMTAEKLYDLTVKFRDFTAALMPSTATILRLQRVFEGVFAALEIGWTVIKGVAEVFKTLFMELKSGTDGKVLKFFAEIGDKVVALNKVLVEGGGIKDFFTKITDAIKDPIPALKDFLGYLSNIGDGAVGDAINLIVQAFQQALPVLGMARDLFGVLKDKIAEFVSSIDIGGVFDDLTDSIKEFLSSINIGGGGLDISDKFGDTPDVVKDIGARFDHLKDIVSSVADFFQSVGNVIGDLWGKISPVLDEVFDHIHDWFSTLGEKLGDAIGTGDFNKVVDVVNVGLLGGILVILRKFFKNGLNIDFGGGLMEKISGTFGQLTDTLKAMQTKIKADALIKIAIALGVLVASLVVLSLIDSAALTKALVAMAVGFAQLAAMMKLMEKVTGSASKFVGLAAGLLLLAGAMLILAIAMKIFATMSWEDIAQGLTAVTVLLGTLVLVAKRLDASDMIKAGAGILILAGGMVVLGLALRMFAGMSLPEMGQGLIGVGAGLVIIAESMKRMPTISPKDGAAIILIAAGLLVLSFAVKQFAELSWGEMAKGFASVAAGLLIIAGAMHLMPKDMLLTAAGLLVVGVALLVIAKAIETFAGMSMGEVGKGLGIIAAALVLLAIAAHAMSGAIVGAIAIGIMAVSLALLTGVLTALSKLSLTELALAIGALAAVFVVLGLAALVLEPVIPALMLLGVALALIGLGFVLFGAGVAMAASGFLALAKAGDAGIKVFVKLLDVLISKIPEFLGAIAGGLLDALQIFVDMLPQLMEMVVTVVTSLLDTVKTLIPEIVSVVVVLIETLIGALVELYPVVIEAGFSLLMALLNGIKEHVPEIVITVAEIIVGFLNALSESLQMIIAAGADLIIKFLEGIGSNALKVIEAGFKVLIDFLEGLANSIRENRSKLWAAGIDIIAAIFGGITEKVAEVWTFFSGLVGTVLEKIGTVTSSLTQKGKDFIIGLLHGLQEVWETVKTFVEGLADRIKSYISSPLTILLEAGKDVIRGLWNGIVAMKDWITNKLGEVGGWIKSGIGSVMKMFSPSRVMAQYGVYIGQGLIIGIDSMEKPITKSSENMGNSVIKTMESTMNKIPNILAGMEEFNPTITPVLDLTGVKKEAQNLSGLLNSEDLTAKSNLQQARIISVDTNEQQKATTDQSYGYQKEIKFEQTINAPTELSTADIYRQTRNLIALAKEELAIV